MELKPTLGKVLSRNPGGIGGNTVWKVGRVSRKLDSSMLRRPKHPGTTSLQLYVLGALFLIPLSIGIVLITNNASRSEHAYQISHDVGSMYAQGVDFSQSANQNIVLSVAEGVGIDIQGGKGVLILSKIRVVHPSDCPPNTASKCSTKGFP